MLSNMGQCVGGKNHKLEMQTFSALWLFKMEK